MDLDPEVHRFIFIHGPPDPAAHRTELAWRIATGWPPPPGGLWVVEWRDAPGLLGWCGLFPLEDTGLYEIGYRYRPQTWGRGVGTEAARAVLGHGFDVLGLDPIVAVTHPDNARSRRLLTKLGMRHEGRAFHYGAELEFYRLERAGIARHPGP